jgi:shikimate kinase
MMGAGKSTVGRIVAARLGRPLRDSDDDIEAQTGRTVREIFETDGEAAFRAMEARALADALASSTPLVIAAAGGVVLRSENRARLRDHAFTVWLRADPSILVERVETGDHRPLLADDPASVLRRLADERRPLYEEAADHIVDVDGLTPDEVAGKVLAAVPG